MTTDDRLFTPADDHEEAQATFLAAALQGDETCRGELVALSTGFEEPYRTIAAELLDQLPSGAFADRLTVQAALEGRQLTRRGPDGRVEVLTASEAVSLVCTGAGSAEAARAYLPILRERLEVKRRDDVKARVLSLAGTYGADPARLVSELQSLVMETQRHGSQPNEAMLFLPYIERLMKLQTGAEIRGLNSGFPLLNQTANGLDTGLFVLAAAPSAGKTTFALQLCHQVATLNRVPALFVSMEQSVDELRAKALARLARLDSRHVARGRFRQDNADDIRRLREAAATYFSLGRYLTIIEGDDTTTVDGIGNAAAAAMARVGAKRCFIVLDYLQILPLPREDVGRVLSPKDRVDLHMSALRRLARRYDSPVLVISSENRVSYDQAGMAVFKESGGIEYSADIAAVMTPDREATRTADGRHRVIDLNIVKNRNGALAVVKFRFHPERAEFVESGKGSVQYDPDE